MTRDEGHAFLVVGRMIERSIGTVQTLGVAFDQGSLPFDVDAMLRSFSALQAFRRRHGLASDPLEVALFLLLAPEVPRSVFACISRLDSRLDSISDADNVTRPRQLVGRLKSRLEFQQVEEEMRADPASTLDSLLTELFAITESVGAHLFQSAEVPTPTAQFIRPGSER